MAETTTVVRPAAAARPYARAAFEDAQAAGALPLWSELLQACRCYRGRSPCSGCWGRGIPPCAAIRKPSWWRGLCRDLRGGRGSARGVRHLPEDAGRISSPASASQHRRSVRAVARGGRKHLPRELISAAAVTDAQRKRVPRRSKRSSSVMSCWTARRMSR
jgi:F-type H+-transporting ATPase subunit delta